MTSQAHNRADCFALYAKMIRMSERFKCDLNELVKFTYESVDGYPQIWFGAIHSFDFDAELYIFAVGIVDNKPVFPNDVVYFKGKRCAVCSRPPNHDFTFSLFDGSLTSIGYSGDPDLSLTSQYVKGQPLITHDRKIRIFESYNTCESMNLYRNGSNPATTAIFGEEIITTVGLCKNYRALTDEETNNYIKAVNGWCVAHLTN